MSRMECKHNGKHLRLGLGRISCGRCREVLINFNLRESHWKMISRILIYAQDIQKQLERAELGLHEAGLLFCEYCENWYSSKTVGNRRGWYYHGINTPAGDFCCCHCVSEAFESNDEEGWEHWADEVAEWYVKHQWDTAILYWIRTRLQTEVEHELGRLP